MAYYERQPPPDDERPGCLDALLITRVAFELLFWPMVALFAVLLDTALFVFLYATYAPLALIPVVLTAIGLWLFARWEQRRVRPPDL